MEGLLATSRDAPWLLTGTVVALPLLMLTVIRSTLLRRKSLRAAARGMGLEFAPEGDSLLDERMADLSLFHLGYGKVASNVLFGRASGLELWVFDYSFNVDGSDGTDATHRQSIVAVRQPGLALPHFLLRPKHVFDTIGEALGDEPLRFADHPGFTQHFRIEADEPETAMELFRPEALRFFTEIARPGAANADRLVPAAGRGWCIEAGGEWLLAYRRGRLIRPNEVSRATDLALQALMLVAA
jgi:hypothetical protein